MKYFFVISDQASGFDLSIYEVPKNFSKMEGQFNTTDNGIENLAFQMQEHKPEKTDSRHYMRNSTQFTGQMPKRKKSLMQLTKEALPRLENYRNSKKAVKRPSLGQLHGGEEIIAVSIY